MESIRVRETTLVNGHANGHSCSNVSERLKSIDSAMSWIRGELEEIKESDRSLMEIFKQLEGDVADLSSCVQTWRYSASFRDSYTPDSRPISFSELDYNTGRSDRSISINSLESTLTSSKEEESSKTSSGSESRLAPEVDSAHGSSSYSPVLSSQGPAPAANYPKHTNGLSTSVTTANISGTKRQTSISPQLKGSTSLNKISSHSPSLISRLQDETSSITSRNSSESIDSGIQFENGSANGVEASNSSPAVTGVTTIAESEDLGDFASDVFSMLGLKS